MDIAIFSLFLVTALFAVGAVLGAPYLPTLKKEGEVALDMLNLRKGQTILDLGSGDGSFLLQAAKRDINGTGWEINPLLVVFSKLRLWRFRKKVKVYWRNMWRTKLPTVDAIYIFGIERYMGKFERKLKNELKKPTLVACFTFKLPTAKETIVKKGITVYRLPQD